MIKSITSVRTVVQPPSGYRFTIFGGLHADSGPMTLEELNSVTDLYHKFNTFNPHSSYKMIERLLNMGYRVQALRTEESNNKISCRRFNTGSSVVYSHPDVNRSYSQTKIVDVGSGVFSQALTFGDLYDDKLFQNYYENSPENTYIVVESGEKKYSLCFGEDHLLVTSSNIFIYDNASSEFESSDIPLSEITFAHLRENYEDMYGNSRMSILEEFFSSYCGFRITKVTSKDWILSSPVKFSPISTCTIPDIKFSASNTGVYDRECELYEDYKVITFYSKYDKNISDTIVRITKNIDSYILTAQQFNVLGSMIYQEIFKVSSNPESYDFIENINDQSDLIQVEYHLDKETDISGTYELRRTSPINHTDRNFLTSLITTELDIFPDIVIDNYPGIYRDDRQDYITALKHKFNTVILSDYYSDEIDYSRVCCVQPDLTWVDTNDTLKGFSYLLYLLPSSGEGGDTGLFYHNELPPSNDYINFILKEDYKYILSKSLVKLTNVLQVRNVITLFAVLNEFSRQVSSRRISDVSNLDLILSSIVSLISEYTNSKIEFSIMSSSVAGRTVQVELQARINTEIIDRYSMSITLTQQGG